MLRLLTLPVRLAGRTLRRLGLARLTMFGMGLVTGLLVARESGRDLRDRLQRRWEDRTTPRTDIDLARQVRDQLAQSPRTWHLPQPEVEVVAGRVVLSGLVPHDPGKSEIEWVVSTVPGVNDVESHLVVGE